MTVESTCVSALCLSNLCGHLVANCCKVKAQLWRWVFLEAAISIAFLLDQLFYFFGYMRVFPSLLCDDLVWYATFDSRQEDLLPAGPCVINAFRITYKVPCVREFFLESLVDNIMVSTFVAPDCFPLTVRWVALGGVSFLRLKLQSREIWSDFPSGGSDKMSEIILSEETRNKFSREPKLPSRCMGWEINKLKSHQSVRCVSCY